jgi:hypothetical protein
VICSFCPRKLDFDPLAVPIPYHHSNLQSEEMIYYVSAKFGSRRGVDVGADEVRKDLDDGKYAFSRYENAQDGSDMDEAAADGDASAAGLTSHLRRAVSPLHSPVACPVRRVQD